MFSLSLFWSPQNAIVYSEDVKLRYEETPSSLSAMSMSGSSSPSNPLLDISNIDPLHLDNSNSQSRSRGGGNGQHYPSNSSNGVSTSSNKKRSNSRGAARSAATAASLSANKERTQSRLRNSFSSEHTVTEDNAALHPDGLRGSTGRSYREEPVFEDDEDEMRSASRSQSPPYTNGYSSSSRSGGGNRGAGAAEARRRGDGGNGMGIGMGSRRDSISTEIPDALLQRQESTIARAKVDATLAVIPADAFKRLTKKFPKASAHIVQG